MNLKIENNQIKINIQDLFENLSEEEMQELSEHYMWHSSIYKNLIQTLKTELGAPGYNEDLYKILQGLFLLPKEDNTWWGYDHLMDSVIFRMKYNVKSLLEENAKLKEENYRRGAALGKVHDWIKEKFGDKASYEFDKTDFGSIYGKPYSYEVAREMANKVDYAEMVEQWCEAMNKKFNPKLEVKDENL